MITIKIQDINTGQALELVNELKKSGYILDQDFFWSYHREHKQDGTLQTKYCEFKFRDPKLATFYTLKWNTK